MSSTDVVSSVCTTGSQPPQLGQRPVEPPMRDQFLALLELMALLQHPRHCRLLNSSKTWVPNSAQQCPTVPNSVQQCPAVLRPNSPHECTQPSQFVVKVENWERVLCQHSDYFRLFSLLSQPIDRSIKGVKSWIKASMKSPNHLLKTRMLFPETMSFSPAVLSHHPVAELSNKSLTSFLWKLCFCMHWYYLNLYQSIYAKSI